MNWKPFDLFKQTYNPFGSHSTMDTQNPSYHCHSQNTARSLFINTTIENQFRNHSLPSNQNRLDNFFGDTPQFPETKKL